VATSKPEEYAEKILQNTGLYPYFTHICGATFDSSRVKKADVLRELFRRGGVENPNADTLAHWRMIGDRIYDMEGAAAFGMGCVGVLWGFGSVAEFAGAEYVASLPGELADRFF